MGGTGTRASRLVELSSRTRRVMAATGASVWPVMNHVMAPAASTRSGRPIHSAARRAPTERSISASGDTAWMVMSPHRVGTLRVTSMAAVASGSAGPSRPNSTRRPSASTPRTFSCEKAWPSR